MGAEKCIELVKRTTYHQIVASITICILDVISAHNHLVHIELVPPHPSVLGHDVAHYNPLPFRHKRPESRSF